MRLALALVACLALVAAPLAAQDPRLEVRLPSGDAVARDAPAVRAEHMLDDRSLRELLNSGFPARLHYRLQLWAARALFDDLRDQREWDVIVRYDPLKRQYTAARIEGERVTPLGTYGTLAGAESAVAAPYAPPTRAPRSGERYYYIVTLDVAMLSVNDLDEVERWLKGEVSPAMRGERNPGTALGRGVRTLVTQLLGGEVRHYQAKTRVFRVQ